MEPELFQLHADVELRHWWFTARRRIMRELLGRVVPPDDGRLVVDVGCGTGANIASLAGRYEVAGIDTTEAAIDHARSRFGDVTFIHGFAPDDLGDLALRMDAVLLMDVLEHVENDVGLLSALVESLKPGGVVLLTVPADMRLWSEHDVSFGHFRRYDMETVRSLWKTLPVDELMCSYFNARLYPIVRAIRTLSRWRSRPWGEARSDLRMPRPAVNRALEGVFAGESRTLLPLLDSGPRSAYTRGVSLISILRKHQA